MTATMLAGGIPALAYAGLRVLLRGRPAPPLRARSLIRRVLGVERRRVAAGSLPYGYAIAAGALLTWAGA